MWPFIGATDGVAGVAPGQVAMRPEAAPGGAAANPRRAGDLSGQTRPGTPGFADVLSQALASGQARRDGGHDPAATGSLRLSAHAAERLRQAGLPFGEPEARALEEAVARVASRGGRECVAVTPRAAYVVHIPSGTVVTAITGQRMREGVFTGIDSAVFVRDAGLDRQAGAPAPRIDGSGAIATPVAREDGVTGNGTHQTKEAVAP